jgi:cysteinyl-tRNA synthetase
MRYPMNLQLTNTLTKRKEVFTPKSPNKLLLYACGITPYDYSHIGHGRSYVFIDLLVRFLKFLKYNVTYVRNVTDIDDKLIVKAERTGDAMRYVDIAREFTELYQQEMGELRCLIPDHEPRVTDNVDKIILFIKGLIDAGCAYEIDGDVYFDITSYKPYGELSGKKLEDLLAGARIDVDSRKKHPGDFALWKGNDKKMFWESPWGYGRPGWHIECSVLAKEFLGETIDIHCGGMDLIFPHHENERAQSESLHKKTFASYWIHNALLNIDKQKMSKSLGNILSLKTIFEKYDPMVLRYYFLQHHYRTPIEFSFESLDAALVAYKKLISALADYTAQNSDCKFVNDMASALADDLNSPKMLGILFENLSAIKADPNCAGSVKKFLMEVCGLSLAPLSEPAEEITAEISELLEKRTQARKDGQWEEADRIRDRLRELGYEVRDKKS